MAKKWRMVTTTTDVADWYSGFIPSALRATAEDKIPETVAFYYLDKPAIFLQRYCDVLRDINYDVAVKEGIKITRGIVAGGGVIYAEPGSEPFVGLVWNKDKHPELPSSPDMVLMKVLGAGADVISERYKIPVRYRPLNDMEIWDPEKKVWRKFMGCGSSGLFNAMGFAWFPNCVKPTEMMAKVLVSPAEKFADKVLKDVMERGWNLEEAGVYPEGLEQIDEIRQDWIEITLETFKKAFGVEVEEGEWEDIEFQYVKEFTNTFHAEQHIFARSAEKKFEEIPEGTSLGKAFLKISGGPLIRAYVLREGDTIKDLMFTGTLQMAPGDSLEKLEQELIGLKIDEKAIREKVQWMFKLGGMYEGGVQIGMLEEPQLVDIIMQACKQSYEE
jgi:lipoate-protein ligase A